MEDLVMINIYSIQHKLTTVDKVPDFLYMIQKNLGLDCGYVEEYKGQKVIDVYCDKDSNKVRVMLSTTEGSDVHIPSKKTPDKPGKILRLVKI